MGCPGAGSALGDWGWVPSPQCIIGVMGPQPGVHRRAQEWGILPGYGGTAWSYGYRLERVHFVSDPHVFGRKGEHEPTQQRGDVLGTHFHARDGCCRDEAARGSGKSPPPRQEVCSAGAPAGAGECHGSAHTGLWVPPASAAADGGICHEAPGPAAKVLQS